MEYYIERQDLADAGVLLNRLVEMECVATPGQLEQVQEAKAELFERHNQLSRFVQDIHAVLGGIAALLQATKSSKADKDKVLKKSTYKRLEIIIDSIVHQENRRREGIMKNKPEFAKVLPEINRKVIECAGELLSFAKTSVAYYPFMIHTVRHLTLLAAAFNYFVPLSVYLLHMMSNLSKVNASSAPLQPVAADVMKVQDKYLNTKVFKEYVLGNSLDLLIAQLRLYSNSLGFPEYASFIALEMKRIRNSPHRSSQWINSKMEGVVKAIKEHSEIVVQARSGLSVMDEEAVRRLEEKIPPFEVSTE